MKEKLKYLCGRFSKYISLELIFQVFESLIPVAVTELCDAADALMLPVRLNYVKPTAPFPLTSTHVDANHGCKVGIVFTFK